MTKTLAADADLRPALNILNHIRTYQLTRDRADLRNVTTVLQRTAALPEGEQRDLAFCAAVEAVLGTNLSNTEKAEALALPASDIELAARLNDGVNSIRDEMRAAMDEYQRTPRPRRRTRHPIVRPDVGGRT